VGIGGRLHVPDGAFSRGRVREDSTFAAKSVSAPERNTNVAARILRAECVNIIVVFMWGLLLV
jgi:hypothetical protein